MAEELADVLKAAGAVIGAIGPAIGTAGGIVGTVLAVLAFRRAGRATLSTWTLHEREPEREPGGVSGSIRWNHWKPNRWMLRNEGNLPASAVSLTVTDYKGVRRALRVSVPISGHSEGELEGIFGDLRGWLTLVGPEGGETYATEAEPGALRNYRPKATVRWKQPRRNRPLSLDIDLY